MYRTMIPPAGGVGGSVREGVHKTTCGVDNHPVELEPFTEKHGVASWREGGSVEISSSQKLYDMIR